MIKINDISLSVEGDFGIKQLVIRCHKDFQTNICLGICKEDGPIEILEQIENCAWRLKGYLEDIGINNEKKETNVKKLITEAKNAINSLEECFDE